MIKKTIMTLALALTCGKSIALDPLMIHIDNSKVPYNIAVCYAHLSCYIFWHHSKSVMNIVDIIRECPHKICMMTIREKSGHTRDPLIGYFKIDATGKGPKIIQLGNGNSRYFHPEKTSDNSIVIKVDSQPVDNK